jgi:hypothetical protein
VDLEAVAADLADALGAIEGLSVPEWGVQRLTDLPAALITLPERVEYDGTYQRGTDLIPDWTVVVLMARPADPEARRLIAGYAAGSGPKSVKQAIEAHTYTACGEPRVTSAEFDVLTYAGNDYLAAIFHLDISGQGA